MPQYRADLQTATLAPASASVRAIALPSHLLPPVTRAVRPERSKSVDNIGIYPSLFALMSKRNNCGILDKFGVPAQEQAQLKAMVDGTRAYIVAVG